MRWLDGQTGACPKCRELHNKVVRVGELFYSDPKFGDGLPPRHPHCRCAVAPVTLDQVKYLPVDHPLRDNRRNSIEELTDIQTYTEINGIRITGERKRHWMTRHPETRGMDALIVKGLSAPDFVKLAGAGIQQLYVNLHQTSSKGRPLYLKIVIKVDNGKPFVLTSYITTQK